MEKVHLSGEMVAALYADKLVGIDPQHTEVEVNEAIPISFTGGFQKKILWLHESSNHPFLSNEDHEMVTKILEACKLSWQDIALVNIHKTEISSQQITEQFHPEYLICSVPEKADQYVPHANLYLTQVKSNCTLLATERLEEIRNDKERKVKLWQALKNMFGL